MRLSLFSLHICIRWILVVALFAIFSENLLWYLDFPTSDWSLDCDPDCLWDLEPGEQHISSEDSTVLERVGDDGMRVSRLDISEKRSYRVLLLGCSFTFGVGVSDRDTYAYKLNDKFQDILFDNGGVGGYGTYRSAVRLKRLLPLRKYDLVIYALLDNHLERGIVPQIRFEDKKFDDKGGKRAHSSQLYAMPFVELTKDFRFVDHPLSALHLPLDEYSVLSTFVSNLYLTYRTRSNKYPSRQESEILLANNINRMAKFASAYGCKFLVISLDGHYMPTKLLASDIETFDCAYYRDMIVNDLVKGIPNNHPNSNVHRFWAEKLYKFLDKSEVRYNLIEYRNRSPYSDHRTLYDMVK